MSQAAALLARGQLFHATQFPATITIAGEDYDASTSGEKRERDLMTGGWLEKVAIAFWLPLSAFGGTPPAVRTPVSVGAKNYVLARTSLDATETTITLHCESPEQ